MFRAVFGSAPAPAYRGEGVRSRIVEGKVGRDAFEGDGADVFDLEEVGGGVEGVGGVGVGVCPAGAEIEDVAGAGFADAGEARQRGPGGGIGVDFVGEGADGGVGEHGGLVNKGAMLQGTDGEDGGNQGEQEDDRAGSFEAKAAFGDRVWDIGFEI